MKFSKAYLFGQKNGYYITEFIDYENPKNNYKHKILISEYKKKAMENFKQMKSKVKIGNYYSFDGIEYSQKIETQEDVKEVLEEIGYDGLCDGVWTQEEYEKEIKKITKL